MQKGLYQILISSFIILSISPIKKKKTFYSAGNAVAKCSQTNQGYIHFVFMYYLKDFLFFKTNCTHIPLEKGFLEFVQTVPGAAP